MLINVDRKRICNTYHIRVLPDYIQRGIAVLTTISLFVGDNKYTLDLASGCLLLLSVQSQINIAYPREYSVSVV